MIKRYDALVDGSELDDEVWAYLSESEDGEAVLYTDYAKLEAENAELLGERDSAEQELYAANATLDALREVFARICKGNEMSEAIDDMDAIPYPTPETPCQ